MLPHLIIIAAAEPLLQDLFFLFLYSRDGFNGKFFKQKHFFFNKNVNFNMYLNTSSKNSNQI
jgi:hypothetical protein